MKKFTIIWTLTLILIVGGLTVIGLNIKKENIGNISEKSLIEQAKKYLGLYTSLYPTKGSTLKLEGEKLKDEGYDPKLEKDCIGYVIISNEDMGFQYKAYVSCPDYVTEGYSNNN